MILYVSGLAHLDSLLMTRQYWFLLTHLVRKILFLHLLCSVDVAHQLVSIFLLDIGRLFLLVKVDHFGFNRRPSLNHQWLIIVFVHFLLFLLRITWEYVEGSTIRSSHFLLLFLRLFLDFCIKLEIRSLTIPNSTLSIVLLILTPIRLRLLLNEHRATTYWENWGEVGPWDGFLFSGF